MVPLYAPIMAKEFGANGLYGNFIEGGKAMNDDYRAFRPPFPFVYRFFSLSQMIVFIVDASTYLL